MRPEEWPATGPTMDNKFNGKSKEEGQAEGNGTPGGSSAPDSMELDETDHNEGSEADADRILSSLPFKFVYQSPLLPPQSPEIQAESQVLAPTANGPALPPKRV